MEPRPENLKGVEENIFSPPYSIYKNFDCIFGQPIIVGDASLILYKQ